jgi:hypothetical protein
MSASVAGAIRSSGDTCGFSLFTGGPLFRIYRRAHLSGPSLQLVTRRVAVITLMTWAPLLVLSSLEGTAWSNVNEPFLLDVDAHARFLVVLPLLVGIERLVDGRMNIAACEFLDRGLVQGPGRLRLKAAADSALRLRDSSLAEVLLLAFVYLVGIVLIWPHAAALRIDTWYWQETQHGQSLTMAGWWFILVSLPLFQFLLYRWYFRLWIWSRFLWQVARLDLDLIPVHPDRCGGLGFLAEFSRSLAPLLFAHGTLAAGVAATGILFEGKTLVNYVPGIILLAAIALLLAVGPLLAFVAPLLRARRIGLVEYGGVAQQYVLAFDRKWVHSGTPPKEQLLGSPDIQSLADLSTSYGLVQDMRPIPISRPLLLALMFVTLLPVALSFSLVSTRELGRLILKALF